MRKHLIRIITITGIALLFLTAYTAIVSFKSPQQETTPKPFRVRTIVIDAGHGGKDPGAHGSYSLEKTVALDIALKLRDAIHNTYPDIKVIMTRDDNTFIPLDQRSQIANNANANLFISIHCNSSPEGTASIAS